MKKDSQAYIKKLEEREKYLKTIYKTDKDLELKERFALLEGLKYVEGVK